MRWGDTLLSGENGARPFVIDHPGMGLWAHICGIQDASFASQMDPIIPNITKIDKYFRFESRTSTNKAYVVLQSPPS